MTNDPEDPEGEALDREIAHDRAEVQLRHRRRVLFVPPLVALLVAAWALVWYFAEAVGVDRGAAVVAAIGVTASAAALWLLHELDRTDDKR